VICRGGSFDNPHFFLNDLRIAFALLPFLPFDNLSIFNRFQTA